MGERAWFCVLDVKLGMGACCEVVGPGASGRGRFLKRGGPRVCLGGGATSCCSETENGGMEE